MCQWCETKFYKKIYSIIEFIIWRYCINVLTREYRKVCVNFTIFSQLISLIVCIGILIKSISHYFYIIYIISSFFYGISRIAFNGVNFIVFYINTFYYSNMIYITILFPIEKDYISFFRDITSFFIFPLFLNQL